jgi:lipocalin-like protein
LALSAIGLAPIVEHLLPRLQRSGSAAFPLQSPGSKVSAIPKNAPRKQGRLMSPFERKAIALIVSLAAPVANPICSQALATPIPLVKVDIDRMCGGWYIVATIPNSFEKGIVAPYDAYSRRADGDIQEDFYF